MDHFFLLAIPLAPLLGSCITGFGGQIIGRRFSHWIAILGVLIAFSLSIKLALDLPLIGVVNFRLYEWIKIGSFSLEVGFLIDKLSVSMMLLVTFVSLMVHIYTIGYMLNDPGYCRFFSYISLFTFAMLMLVMSNNLLQMFFGWEAVGLVSYLLIGFWYSKSKAIYANTKAFLINRIGDVGFILGIGLLFSYTGSLNYDEIFSFQHGLPLIHIFNVDCSLLTLVCICLFIAAMAKSAQFPMHIWLPDSMEGPTPISALIHAATMVTAGIFMVIRMSPLFEQSDTVLSMMIIVGSLTALLTGLLGVVENDIKRIIAYSTLSQLGYMTVALGVSAYPLALFHLITHAFFKALLFLSAGSVIIGMHHEQDIKKMGGLWRYMPITWLTSLIGSLSLVGFPFFSGFYSKESIIEAVNKSYLFGANFAYFALLLTVFFTAFYTFRMFFLVFHGEPNFKKESQVEKLNNAMNYFAKESSFSIVLPLLFLAIPSMLMGAYLAEDFIAKSIFSSKGMVFENVIYISPKHEVMKQIGEGYHGFVEMGIHSIRTLPFWFSMAGIFLTWYFCFKKSILSIYLAKFLKPFLKLLERKYYLDDIVYFLFVYQLLKLSHKFWKYGDITLIDGLVNKISDTVYCIGLKLRMLQTGFVYHYLCTMIFAVLLFCFFPVLF